MTQDDTSKLMFIPVPLATGACYQANDATEPTTVQAITVTISLADGTHIEHQLTLDGTGWWLRAA